MDYINSIIHQENKNGTNLGVWPLTSSVDWCESNYAISPYIAEFWNSISSIAMILIGEIGSRLNSCERTPLYIAFRLISLVGVGSFLFHATLTYYMQALDEVPMVWCALTLLRPLFEINYGRQGPWLTAMLTSVAITLSLLVTIVRGGAQFVAFQISFSFLEAFTIYLMTRIYNRMKSNHPAIKTLFRRGLTTYLFAILIWLTDLQFCEYLNGGERSLLPFNPQLHAAWHALASFGLYLLVVFTVYAWWAWKGENVKLEMGLSGLLPFVVKIHQNDQDQSANSKLVKTE
ncbi:4546_t:CDS:2 [Ambispora gerdemannii]|uniref:4546_t:CDS:1 n=1 Tax=Ambispora gerdemannii TaxID=144530 RepID=A0A9N9A6U9_9GLOM|nr:4546_t:CDS:2 [Ambispora gerdemannii]